MKLLAKPSRRLTVLVLLVAAGVTTILGATAAEPLRRLTHYILPPFGDLPMYLTTQFKRNVVGSPSRLSAQEARRLQRENDILRRRLAVAEGELARRLGMAADMNRARLGPLKDFPCELIPARVVAADALPYGRTRLANVGESRGVRPDMRVTTRELLTDRSKRLPGRWAAVTPTALVGRITNSSAFAARLQLLTDRGFEMRVHIVRDPDNPREITVITPRGGSVQMLNRDNRFAPVEAWIRGNGTDAMTVPSIPKKHNVLSGDWVTTRDDDTFLPAAVRIGRVVRVTNDPEHAGFVNLRVAPSVQMSSLREVYIVVPLGRLTGAPEKAKR